MSKEGIKETIMLGVFLLWEQHCRAAITQSLGVSHVCEQLPRAGAPK